MENVKRRLSFAEKKAKRNGLQTRKVLFIGRYCLEKNCLYRYKLNKKSLWQQIPPPPPKKNTNGPSLRNVLILNSSLWNNERFYDFKD